MKTRFAKLPPALAALPPREGGTYVVMLPLPSYGGSWGRGATLAEAFSHARRSGGVYGAKKPIAVYWQPDSSWQAVDGGGRPHVDDMGALCWFGERPEALFLRRK